MRWTAWSPASRRRGGRWFYRYDPFGRRLTKVKQFSDTERAWVAKRHPALVSAGDREGTVLWTWPQAPNGHAAHDPRAPIVGTHFLWDGDVIAEEAPLRLDGSIDWDDATRWHYEPESFVPAAGVRDARTIYQQDSLYGPGIRGSLQDVIHQNKNTYPGVFQK